MNKILIKTILVLSALAVFSSVHAKCYNINTVGIPNPGVLVPAKSCVSIWRDLNNSGNFPDIFSAPHQKLLNLHNGGVCFVSDSSIAAVIGTTPVLIDLISTFTTEFVGPLFGGSDNLDTVITHMKIRKLENNKFIGSLFNRDVIDMISSSEQDNIVAGTDSLFNAKGAFRVESIPTIDFSVSPPQITAVNITKISGEFCN